MPILIAVDTAEGNKTNNAGVLESNTNVQRNSITQNNGDYKGTSYLTMSYQINHLLIVRLNYYQGDLDLYQHQRKLIFGNYNKDLEKFREM